MRAAFAICSLVLQAPTTHSMATINLSNGLATLQRPMRAHAMAEPVLDMQTSAVHTSFSRDEATLRPDFESLEEMFVMQSNAGSRFDSVDSWEALINLGSWGEEETDIAADYLTSGYHEDDHLHR